MKTFADEHWERTAKIFSPFQRLWKTDDEGWLAARKEAWRAANEHLGGGPYTEAYGKYYIYGEEPPRCFVDGKGREEDIRFDILKRIAYTPFTCADDLHQFWEAMIERNPGGVRNDHANFQFIGSTLDKFPECDQMVKLVTETMFSPDYFMRMADGKEASIRNLVTIDPSDFVVSYTGLETFYQPNNRHECDYRNFAFDYFMRSVRECEVSDEIEVNFHKYLIRMYAFLLQLDESELSQYRLELKQKIIGAAENSDAPELLREALKAAREKQNQ